MHRFIEQTLRDRDAFANRAMLAGASVAIFLLVAAIRIASHWPLIADAPLMHYIVFLLSKGFRPYSDIVDMNMPGSYLMEGLAMRTLGAGARGWFLLDVGSIAITVLASAWIAGPLHRASGVLAGSLAGLMHLADGAWDLGQRDWIVAALLVLSFACLIHHMRGHSGAWITLAALCAGLAATIKPPALLFAFVGLALVCWWRRRTPWSIATLLLWALAGFALPCIMVFAFLIANHATSSFFATLHGLVPYYASLQKASLRSMLWQNLGHREQMFELIAVGSVVLFAVNRSWRSFESSLLLAGSLCGLFSYVVQAKGFTYHRYPAYVFFFLLIATQADVCLRLQHKRFGVALLTLAALPIIGILSIRQEHDQGASTFNTVLHLQADLDSLGGPKLSGHVQCLDMTYAGCINALYRMHLVQSTGFIYDFYLFPKRDTPLTLALQRRFLAQVTQNPPQVFVLSQQVWPGNALSYDQVNRWPAFSSLLSQHYRLAKEYQRVSPDPGGYRLYLAK